MTRILKRAAQGLLILLVVLAGLGLWQRERVARLGAVLTLFDEGRIVGNFSAMEDAFPTTPMPLSGPPATAFEDGPALVPPAGFDAWVTSSDVTGIVVLKGGRIAYEAYPLSAPDRTDDPALRTRISWSLAKSFLSVLFGVIYEEGAIDSLDDPVIKYVPDLSGSAYDGTTIRNVLQMSSGVSFDEDYLDFWSDINKMGRILGLGGSMDRFAIAQDETFVAPGERWQYVSIDTHILGMVIRGATGRTVPDLLNERVLSPLGLEVEPRYITDGKGVAFVLGGLLMSTRDYARFGQMVADGGVAGDTRIISEDWIAESIAPSAPTEDGKVGYGYQWWIPIGATEGQVFGRGIYGQYLYIDRPRDVVIAVNAADREFREAGVHAANMEMIRAIAEALD